MKLNKKTWSVVQFILIAAGILISERFFAQQNFNFLSLHDHFRLSKKARDSSLMGADQFLISRSGVAQGKLHLHRWHNYQELRSRHKNPRDLRVKASVDPSGEIDLFWTDNQGHREGMRIRKNGSAFWDTGTLGEWQKSSALNVKFEKADNNFLRSLSAYFQNETLPELEVDLGIHFGDQNVDVFQNGRKLDSFPLNVKAEQWGIAGHGEAVDIDDLEEDGVTEDFEAPYMFHYFVLMSPLLLIPFFTQKLFFTTYLFFISSLSFWSLDRFHFSHFSLDFRATGMEEKNFSYEVEEFRKKLFGHSPDISRKLIEKDYPVNAFYRGPVTCTQKGCSLSYESANPEKHPRIMFVGSSQTIGVGADKLEDTFFAVAHKRILKELPKLQGLNISVAGATPEQMSEIFSYWFEDWKPDFIVINFGFNGEKEEYEPNIRKIFKESKGKILFLVNEAMEKDIQPSIRLARDNPRLASEFGAKLIPLHQYMSTFTNKKEEFLWWDIVHFNNRGHFLAGNFVADEIINLLKIKSSGKPGYTDGKL